MGFLQSFRGEYNPSKRDEMWAPLLSQEFPTLCEALQGTPPDVKGTDAVPPLTLMIFQKEGKLRFSLSNRDFPRAFYGAIGDPLHVLESIEDALMNEHGEWATKKINAR